LVLNYKHLCNQCRYSVMPGMWSIYGHISFKEPLGLSPTFTLVSGSAYSTLKMETICPSGTSVDFQRTRRRYVPHLWEPQFPHLVYPIRTARYGGMYTCIWAGS
jgi:hypothetical protein